MKKNNDYLYIFLHIPKTAGSTFRYHIDKNMKPGQKLLLDRELLGIKKDREKLTEVDYQVATKKYISKLSEAQKSKIKIIYGHTVYYGVHKYFSRQARYITFIRNPIERTLSLYNYKRSLFSREDKNGSGSRFYTHDLLISGSVPTFMNWLDKKYDSRKKNTNLSMANLFKLLGYATKDTDVPITDALNKFYFIGITEKFSEDSLFLYDAVGINKYFVNQNISSKRFMPGNQKKTRKAISKKNIDDKIIYEKAVLLNKTFKNNNDYTKRVGIVKIQRLFLLPFTQLIFAPRNTIENVKFMVREKVPTVYKFVKRLKNTRYE